MKKKSNRLLLISIGLILLSCQKEEVTINEEKPTTYDGWVLIWNDEFNKNAVDLSNWTFELGDGTDYGLPKGWGNNELQTYTKDEKNVKIISDENKSVLAITANKEDAGGYTSAKLTTNKLKSIRYGRIETKVKFPKGQGFLPAIWLLGENRSEINWPGCGEIDIIEVLGHEPDKMYSTLHYTNSEHKHAEKQDTLKLNNGNFSENYHDILFDWTPDLITISIDGNQLPAFTIDNDMKEFLRSFYLIVNLAVGGNWPGNPDETTTFPQTMFIDYIRIYEKENASYPEAPALDMAEETVGQYVDPMLAYYSIHEGFDILGEMEVIVYGPGGPAVKSSDNAVNGDKSLAYEFPGGNWGGAYIKLSKTVNLSSFSNLVFSLHKPADLYNVEVKLESSSNSASVLLADYTPTDIGNGWVQYSIPLSDFIDLDLTDISIPFALWNPVNINTEFVLSTVLIDNLYFN